MKFASLVLAAATFGSLFWLGRGELDPTFVEMVTSGPYSKIGTILGGMVDAQASGDASLSGTTEFIQMAGSNVVVEVIFTDATTAMNFQDAGFQKQTCLNHVCSGIVAIEDLVTLSQSSGVISVRPSFKPHKSVGAVTSEGDPAMITNLVREIYGVKGKGMVIGVLSDSYNCVPKPIGPNGEMGANADIATGDLPSDVKVKVLAEWPNKMGQDPCAGANADDPSDEGRAMLQLIFDVAPESTLQFHTADPSITDFAKGIRALAAAGCDVIVDDITYPSQAIFQDDAVTQAVDDVAAMGIPYFSSAGNQGRQAWHNEGFVDSGMRPFVGYSGTAHNFDKFGGIDFVQNIGALVPGESYSFVLQWDEPFRSVSPNIGCSNNLDFFLVDRNTLQILSESLDNNVMMGDAIEIINFKVPSDFNQEVGLVITKLNGDAPRYIKWYVSQDVTAIEYDVISSTLVAHHNAANGAGVGAADYKQTPVFGTDPPDINDFSSRGGNPIFFDKEGNRLNERVVRDQPRFVGPDGGITTFFGDENRFSGTSAAAPHVAALALLLKQLDSTLTPEQIYTILQNTAIDMDDPLTPAFDKGFDFKTGYGFVDGLAAAQVVSPPDPLPTFNYVTEFNYGFKNKIFSLPSDEEISGVTRLTQIFYRRTIASEFSLAYNQVNVVFNFVEIIVGDDNIRVVYDTEVLLDRAPGFPTVAQVKGILQQFDTMDYLFGFVHIAEPDDSIFHESTSVYVVAVAK